MTTDVRSDTIDLEDSRHALLNAAADLPAAAYDTPNVVGVWSIRACLAHFVVWDRWVLDALDRADRGEPTSAFPNEQEMNAAAAARWGDANISALTEMLTEAIQELAQRLQAQTDDERETPCFNVGEQCLSPNDVVDALIAHNVMHTADIRAWRKTANL